MVENEKNLNPQEKYRESKPWGARIAAWIGLLTLLGIVGWALIRAQEGPVSPGKLAPEFELTSFNGEVISSADLDGKVVVLNFWSSWCKPCESEAADLETAWRQYQSRGDIVFLGVDYVDTEPEAKVYLEKFDITYPNGPDLRTNISQAFRIRGVPETYIIAKDGILAHAQIGPFSSLAQIHSVIDPLLNQ